MEKNFNEFTVRELGDILEGGLANINKQTSDEYGKASDLVKTIKAVTLEIESASGELLNTKVCTVIYPFYYIYKYVSNNYPENDSQFLVQTLECILNLCREILNITPAKKRLKAWDTLTDNWEGWWNDQPDRKEMADLWMDESLKVVGRSIVDRVPDDCEWKWKEYLKEITLQEESLDNSVKSAVTQERLEPQSITFNEIEKYIGENVSQIILTGAPGTGKTKVAKELASFFGLKLEWETPNKDEEDKDEEDKDEEDKDEEDKDEEDKDEEDKDEEDKDEEDKDKGCPLYKLVQFHPSYDYTDFVEGLRPVEVKVEKKDKNGKETELAFKKIDGIFKHFCRKVVEANDEEESEENSNGAEEPENAKKPQKKYFFIIDEINRADLSKVFGELMYCLEKDKRGIENKIDTQYQNLSTYDVKTKKELAEADDVFAQGFYIPENVVIIGTMNDIDRSVESMDMALRRRFVWHEVEVTKPLLQESLSEIFRRISSNISDEIVDSLAERIMAFNHYMVKDSYYGLNKHYYISQGQFTDLLEPEDLNDLEGILKKAWDWRIKGLIEEYVRGEDTADTFVEKCEEAFLKGPELEGGESESDDD